MRSYGAFCVSPYRLRWRLCYLSRGRASHSRPLVHEPNKCNWIGQSYTYQESEGLSSALCFMSLCTCVCCQSPLFFLPMIPLFFPPFPLFFSSIFILLLSFTLVQHILRCHRRREKEKTKYYRRRKRRLGECAE